MASFPTFACRQRETDYVQYAMENYGLPSRTLVPLNLLLKKIVEVNILTISHFPKLETLETSCWA